MSKHDIKLFNDVQEGKSCVILTEAELDKLIARIVAKFPITKQDVTVIFNHLRMLTADQLQLINVVDETKRSILKLIDEMDNNERLKLVEAEVKANRDKGLTATQWGLICLFGATTIMLFIAVIILYNQ